MSDALLSEVKQCQICKDFLPYDPNPIVQFNKRSKILIIGQTPGIFAHSSSKPWNDKSGERLRQWLDIADEQFYNPSIIALVPMGFCYPGKGKSGDLPPRKECANKWMDPIRNYLTNIELEVYIGKYACDRAFGEYGTLTDLIKSQYKSNNNKIVLPHPSPRNNIWLAKNRWFEQDALPSIKRKCRKFL